MIAFTPTASFRSTPRRAFRLADPRLQVRLALGIFATTLVFGLLAVGNSYAAYKSLFDVALSTVPIPLGEVLLDQTRHFLTVTTILATGYALAVLGLSVIFVQRMIGPLVAIERHVRSLRSGDYSSRIGLRSGRSIFAVIAVQLNELAMRLDREATESELQSHRAAQAA
jgi:hypothetical protein